MRRAWTPNMRGARAAYGVVLWAVLALLAASALPWFSGDSPEQRVFRARFGDRPATPEALAGIRAEIDAPDSVWGGIAGWFAGAVRADLGESWVSGEPVAPQVVSAWLVSLNLALWSTAAAAVIATALTWWHTVRVLRGRGTGGPVVWVAVVMASAPAFVLATVSIVVVSLRAGLLPAAGWSEPQDAILPCLALAVPTAGVLTSVMCQGVSATAAEAWLVTWRANGVRQAVLVWAVLRRAVASALPLLALTVAGTIGASVVIEKLFAIPGLGRLALDACLAQDQPVVQGVVAALVLTGVVFGVAGMFANRAVLGPLARQGQGATLVADATTPVRLTRVGGAGLLALAAIVVAGLPRSAAITPRNAYASPSPSMPFGADGLGRDVLARVADGALASVGLAVACSAVCLVVGVLIGVMFSGSDAGAADVLNAVPPVFVGIVLASVMQPGFMTASLAVCAVGWIPIAVHTRALLSSVKATGFYDIAVLNGASAWWRLRHHVVPMIRGEVLRHALVRVPHLALALTGLSFLGLGAPHDSPEWGNMLSDAMIAAERAPWGVAAPTVALILLGLCANGFARERAGEPAASPRAMSQPAALRR